MQEQDSPRKVGINVDGIPFKAADAASAYAQMNGMIAIAIDENFLVVEEGEYERLKSMAEQTGLKLKRFEQPSDTPPHKEHVEHAAEMYRRAQACKLLRLYNEANEDGAKDSEELKDGVKQSDDESPVIPDPQDYEAAMRSATETQP